MRLRIASRAAIAERLAEDLVVSAHHDGIDVERTDEVGEGRTEVAAGAGDDLALRAPGRREPPRAVS